jgi:hypothetical protein
MARFVFPAPVLPGKQASAVAGVVRGRMSEYEESRRQKGISVERAYEMATPMGTFVIAYIDAVGDFASTMGALGASQLPVDVAFKNALAEVHGMDVTQPPPGPGPEEIGHWRDPEVRDRKRGLAFVAPLLPGKGDAARAFAREAWGTRVDELAASRRALGVCEEIVCLNATPEGDLICVYLEGDDPAEGNARFAASRTPFDVWFKEQCRSLFPPDIDFDNPLPPISTVWEWHRSAVTA